MTNDDIFYKPNGSFWFEFDGTEYGPYLTSELARQHRVAHTHYLEHGEYKQIALPVGKSGTAHKDVVTEKGEDSQDYFLRFYRGEAPDPFHIRKYDNYVEALYQFDKLKDRAEATDEETVTMKLYGSRDGLLMTFLFNPVVPLAAPDTSSEKGP